MAVPRSDLYTGLTLLADVKVVFRSSSSCLTWYDQRVAGKWLWLLSSASLAGRASLAAGWRVLRLLSSRWASDLGRRRPLDRILSFYLLDIHLAAFDERAEVM